MKYQQGEHSKLELIKNKEDNIIADYGYKLLSPKILNEVFKEFAICNKCKQKKGIVQVFEDHKARKGLAEKLVLKCSNCTNKIDFFTSEHSVSRDQKFQTI